MFEHYDDETTKKINSINQAMKYYKGYLALCQKFSNIKFSHSELKEINENYSSFADGYTEWYKLVSKHRNYKRPISPDTETLSSMSESEKAKLMDDNSKIIAIITKQNNEEYNALNSIKRISEVTANKFKAIDKYCTTAPEVKDAFLKEKNNLYVKIYKHEPPTEEEIAKYKAQEALEDAKAEKEQAENEIKARIFNAKNEYNVAKSHLELAISEAKTAIVKKDAEKVVAAKAALENATAENRPAAEAAVAKAMEEAKISYENIDKNETIELDSNVIEARKTFKEAEDTLEDAEAEVEH